MARAALVVGVLVLVVASGCLTADPAGTPQAEQPSTTVPFEVPERSIERQQNPWGGEPIEVVVDNPSGLDTDVHPEVGAALHYWESRIDPGKRYAPEFRMVDHTDDPEIRVEVVKTIDGCGVHEDDVALGCAPVIPENATVTDPVTVQVRAGHSRAVVREILKHEFGHVLGYRHGEGPGSVMAGNLSARSPENVTDAVNRRFPWASDALDVAVVSTNGSAEREREQVRRALDYYERGADGTVGAPPTFELVDDPADADIVVELRDSVTDCRVVGRESSCAHWDGPDVDSDDAPEYLTRARIVV
ncbi:MAG: hypothetical protein ABEH83_11915, partial [Halobacterium sp.]